MKKFNCHPNCFFTHSITADLVFILMGIFSGKVSSNIESIYTGEHIEAIKSEHRFLNEVIASMPVRGYEMLEFLLLNNNFNDVAEYKNFILGLKDDEFFYYLYGQFVDIELIKEALLGDDGLNRLYSNNEYISTSFLALKSLFNNKMLFIDEFFSCIKGLYTREFTDAYEQITAKYNEEYDKLDSKLMELEPLEFSQKLMGKTFKNRGPYKDFTFIPSYFINGRAVRFFGKNQILMYSINHDQFTREDITKILRVISDDKRFEIIELLSQNKPLMGKELAEKLGLSKATVSHHVEQLKETGFINEERIKNSKFYSINHASVDKFLDYLSLQLRNK